MNETKIVLKSLSRLREPVNAEKCGHLIQSLYDAVHTANTTSNFKNVDIRVVRHNHHKAVIVVYYLHMEDFVNFKDYFYRYYADRFTWRERWHAR